VVRDARQINFTSIKSRIKQRWRRLTDEEIDELEGRAEVLVSKLQECYGWEREEAERQVREFRSRHNWQ
jgi:uncharacterized protein YjbJ (UPF0337 family)